MPDVFPEAYNHEDVASFVRALESAEQYSMEYIHKMVNESLLYVDSGITTLDVGESFYSYMETPSDESRAIVAFEPNFQSDTTFELHAYFNADVDTVTFNPITVKNLNSGTFDAFKGDVWAGSSNDVTINDTNNEFFTGLVGGGKKSGGSTSGSLIVEIEPGDSLLFEIRNNGSLNSNTTGTIAFQAPYHEQTEQYSL